MTRFSKIGFILAAAGSAIGLGGIWKFPYMVGESGGGAFVFVFIVAFLVFGLSVFIVEMILGRASERDCFSTFESLAPKGRKYLKYGGVMVFSGVVIFSFYVVVLGWLMHYMVLSLTGLPKTLESTRALWGEFVGAQVEPFAQLAVCCHPFASLHRITDAIHRAQRRAEVGQRKEDCIAEQKGLPLLVDGRVFHNPVEKPAVDAAVREADKLFGGKLIFHGIASSMALGMAKVRQVQDASDISGSGEYAGFNEFRRFLMLGRSAAELIIIGRAAEIDDICFGDKPSAAAVDF